MHTVQLVEMLMWRLWVQPLIVATRAKPAACGFFSSAAGGYMVATQYKTLYRWRHSAGMTAKTKNPGTKLIAGFLYGVWGG